VDVFIPPLSSDVGDSVHMDPCCPEPAVHYGAST